MIPFRAFSRHLWTCFGPFVVHYVLWVRITVMPNTDTFF